MQTTIVSIARVTRVVPSRHLATNLFAHPIERLSLNDLRQEAKRRGLSPSGNKATLITRIQHVGKRADGSTPISNDGSDRGLATATAPTSVAPQRPPRPTLDLKLPDLSPPQDTDGPHIPFLPDFWDSSRTRAPDAIHHSPAESPMPKVLIVADAHASSPAYSVSDHSESDEDHAAHEMAAVNSANAGFWEDVAADIGLPHSFSASASLARTRDAVLSVAPRDSSTQNQTETRPSMSSRPLSADEARGVWVILAILGGSWLAGGLFGSSKKATPISES